MRCPRVARTQLLFALLFCLPAFVFAPLPSRAQTTSRTFAETGRTVRAEFLDYWNTHGGLAQQGFPISEEIQEKSDTDGKIYTVQYFERAVFELHPENPPPYNVLLSLLGTLTYNQKYPGGAPAQRPNTSQGSVLFPQTGKRLGGLFLDYWNTHGGLAQQGYPISEEFTETSDLDGKTYTVQYFERAVFESHPENGAPYNVLLTLLGTLRYAQKHSSAGPSSLPSGVREFAAYLTAKYDHLGATPLLFTDSVAEDGAQQGHYIELHVDAGTAQALKSAGLADARAWGEAVLADATSVWPSAKFTVTLSWPTYSPSHCDTGCDSDCYFQDASYVEGRGWFTVYTFVSVRSGEPVLVCDSVGGGP